jgi:hypothetical protein
MRKFLGLSLVLAACAADVETSSVDEALTGDNGTSFNGTSFNGTSYNGTSLNGTSFNGTSLNGTSFNGTSFNGTSYNGTSLNGTSLNGTSLNGTSFNGTSYNGTSYNGTSFNGATFTGQISNGSIVGVHVDDVDPLDSGANSDVLVYALSAELDGGWVRLCGDEPDGSAVRAIPLAGQWDSTTGAYSTGGDAVTWACRHSSIAKCVEMGYKPWSGYGDQLLACVRMLRADYCGDGVSHTVNGTLINVYDSLGIQTDTESWPVDAAWTPNGATCVNNVRGGSTSFSCYSAKYSASCGFGGGALMVDEYGG